MAEPTSPTHRDGIVLAAGEGRAYPMGRLSAVFKADGAESAGRYSISEWWLEPRTPGPGPHSHPEDDVFYVIEGTISFLIGDRWVDASKGAFVLAPGGVTHDFENRGTTRAGFLNYLRPDLRRQGIGTLLLDEVRRHSPDGMSLHVFQQNTDARAFYERHDFTVLDTNDGDRNMENLPDMPLRWTPHRAR